MTNDRKGRDIPEEKNLGASPENKVRRSGREGEEPDPNAALEEGEYGADGCYHVMEQEMIAAGMTREAPEDQGVDKPAVVHLEELRMKGEAVDDYLET